MDIQLTYTFLLTAILVVLFIPMGVRVGVRRARIGVAWLHGDDQELLARIRGHGNFSEHVPLALFAMAGAELLGAPAWLLIAAGVLLLFGRLFHYAALVGWGPNVGRPIGALATNACFLIFAGAIFWGLYTGSMA